EQDSYYHIGSRVFSDMGAKCEKCRDKSDALMCYEHALEIASKIGDQTIMQKARDQIVVLKRQLANPNAAQDEIARSKTPESIRSEIDMANHNAGVTADPAEAIIFARKFYNLCRKYEPNTTEAFHATSFLCFLEERLKNRARALELAHE